MSIAKPVFEDFSVWPIPMWKGSSNNYAYLVTDIKTKESLVIDPANPPEVLPVIKEAEQSGKIDLKCILNTHHHWDHAGGNDELLKYKKLPIRAGKDCQSVTETPKDGGTFKLGSTKFKALYTPCHTQDSICWYVESQRGDKAVFTGDTLFHGGCGRFFEGSAQEMQKALNETLAALPDDTVVYPGHEYTKNNWKFINSLLGKIENSELAKKIEIKFKDELEKYVKNFNTKEEDATCGKYTIGQEKEYNPFMLTDKEEMQKATGKTSPVDVMGALREMKNSS